MTDVRILTSDAEIEALLRKHEASPYLPERTITRVRYLEREDMVLLALSDGARVYIPRSRLQGLRGASLRQLRKVEIVITGTAVSWSSLDADFSLGGLLRGTYGTPSWMKMLSSEDTEGAPGKSSHRERMSA